MAAYDRPSSYEPILKRYLALQPDGWYLAHLDGEPVGLGGAVDFGLTDRVFCMQEYQFYRHVY